MSINNFIPISRKIFEHQFWCDDRVYSRFEAWLDLIQSARFEDTKLYIGNKVVEVKRGQVYSSLRYLSERWSWSTKRVTGFLELLIADNMLSKETVKETGQTVITILNYDTYNKRSESEETPKETPRKQQGNSRETKYNKENKENNINTIPPTPLVGEVAVVKTWRDDFSIYLSDLRQAFKVIVTDTAYISEREKYHPGINIKLSLEKACVEFWALDVGWKHKKKGKSANLDWKSTFTKSLNQKQNQVWLQKNEQKNGETTTKKYDYL